ncbi:MAG: Mur ligase domain-containing protein [Planctomycetota bacterium]
MSQPPPDRTPASLIGRASRVFLVGIGGAGMSAIARVLAARGAEVHGCDATATPITDALAADGLRLAIGDDAALPGGTDLVIASAAIPADHPVRTRADASGVPVLGYSAALGGLMDRHTGIAIAGTHGKSTTAAMLGAALVDAGLDPTAIVGATSRQLTSGALAADEGPVGSRLGAPVVPRGPLAGRPGLLVAEACEFNRSFLDLRPTIGCIGGIEADHLDQYGSLGAVVDAFARFAALLPPAADGGVLLMGHNDPHRLTVSAATSARVETVGCNPHADWTATYDEPSGVVSVRHGGTQAAWRQRMPGPHNAENAAMAFAAACTAGADASVVAESLGAFRGVDRRCQLLGERPVAGGAVRVYDDYGHHPTEVDATLRAIRRAERPEARGGRLIAVFQPHQHTRTRFLLDGFAASFSAADHVVVPEIYRVRETEADRRSVGAQDLVNRVQAQGVDAVHVHPFANVVAHLDRACRPGDVVVVMGAGPVWQVARDFMANGAPRDATRPAVAHA